MQTRLLAEAAYLAAEADEPLELNPIRRNALAYQEANNCDFETAALRVFSNSEGAYGSNVNLLVDSGAGMMSLNLPIPTRIVKVSPTDDRVQCRNKPSCSTMCSETSILHTRI